MSDKTAAPPSGVIKLLLGPDGRVIAHAADFKPDRPGGYTVRQAQENRCRRALAFAVVEACASPMLCGAIDGYDAERIVDRLTTQGCTVQTVHVGLEPNGSTA